jgi:hypothetical protein
MATLQKLVQEEVADTSSTFERWLKSKRKRFGVYVGAAVATASNLVAGVKPLREHFPRAIADAIAKQPLVVPVVVNTVAIIIVAFFILRVPTVDEQRLGRASKAVRQLHMWWRCAWACWAVFYLALALKIAAEIVGASPAPPPLPTLPPSPGFLLWNAAWAVGLDLIDNTQTAFLVCCFYVLARPTVASTGPQPEATNPFSLLFIAVVLLTAVEVVICLGTSPDSPARLAPTLLAGLCSGTAIALITGRLDSKFIGLPYVVVTLLYAYAAMQVADVSQVSWVKTALYALAVPAKLAMFVVFYWLFHSGRGLYYLYSMTEVSLKLASSWSVFDSTLKSKSATFVDRFWYQPAMTETKAEWDVFISAPMAGHGANFKRHNEWVKKIAAQLRAESLKVFYAGDGITDRTQFDLADDSLRNDLVELRKSRRFLLIYPTRTASSVLVEAGIALASNKPSVYFAKPDALPFLLRRANTLEKGNVRIEDFRDYEEVAKKVSTHGLKLFPDRRTLGGLATVPRDEPD